MNGYLLDTNVPSEFSRDRPEPRVVKWLKAQPVTTLFLSAIFYRGLSNFVTNGSGASIGSLKTSATVEQITTSPTAIA